MDSLVIIRRINALENEDKAQQLFDNIILSIRKHEQQSILTAINKKIEHGKIGGNGWDKTAERNGLILASNIIIERGT